MINIYSFSKEIPIAEDTDPVLDPDLKLRNGADQDPHVITFVSPASSLVSLNAAVMSSSPGSK